jgi:hypothetical protein
MFTVTIGALTVEVECPLIENMAAEVAAIKALLEDPTADGPRIEFTIGPVAEQPKE